MLVQHVADIAKRHARVFFPEAPERHIREVLVRIRCGAIKQYMRAQPVAAAHLGYHRAAVLHQVVGNGVHMCRVVFVVLHHPAIFGLEHHHIVPAAVPQLGHAHFLVERVEPAVFGHGPFARHIKRTVHTGAATAIA